MDFSEEQLESLSRKIEERERLARRRAWLVTVIPIIFAGLLLTYTVWQISIKQGELNQKTSQLALVDAQMVKAQKTQAAMVTAKAQAQTELSQAQADLSQSQIALATSTAEYGQIQEILNRGQSFLGNACPISEEVIKEYTGNDTPQVQLFLFLLEMQQKGVPWNPDGFSETDGFDSPNFALYAMQNGIPGSSLTSVQPGARPSDILQSIPRPNNGDIVYYQSGYTMFYYELPASYASLETRPCVIGMTPLGIISLQVDFAQQLGFLQVPYSPP